MGKYRDIGRNVLFQKNVPQALLDCEANVTLLLCDPIFCRDALTANSFLNTVASVMVTSLTPVSRRQDTDKTN